MRHPRITIAAIVIAIGGTAGGLGIASAAGGTSAAYGPSVSPAGAGMQPAASATTIHTATATVSGKSETILVDAKGEPLYTFTSDTATTSGVKGQLAALWPPLESSATPTVSGASGKLTLVSTSNGRQVAYNGRFLYTFVDDSPGHVTGQGVQDFFIATPDTGATGSSAGQPAAPSTNGYGY